MEKNLFEFFQILKNTGRIVFFIALSLFFSVYAQKNVDSTSQTGNSTTINSTISKTKSALSYYEQGKQYQNDEDWFGAIECYQEAIRLNDSYSDAWFAMAQCSYSLEQYDLCLAYLTSAEKYRRNNTEILNLRGFALLGLGKLSEARTVFNGVLNVFPNNIDARFGLAELDLFDGRISAAEKLYVEALRRQSDNRKALLSLALVSHELNKTEAAKKYIEQAMVYYSGEAEVYYYSAWIKAQESDFNSAESLLRTAIKLDSSYVDAYKLLSTVLFESGRYSEAIDICDMLIAKNRNTSSAWFLKGLACEYSGRNNDAIVSYETGLEIDANDEVMRAALELLAFNETNAEDSRRAQWADYHIKSAESFTQKYQLAQARYEYQRALRLDPYNTELRYKYAANLLLDGYPERYLEQLKFIKERSASTTAIDDTIEAYDSLLYDTLPKRWNIDTLYLDKSKWNIGLYYLKKSVQPVHPDAERITTGMLESAFAETSSIKVTSKKEPVTGYAEAFRTARIAGHDYFCIISVDENERELTVHCAMYSAKNGTKLAQFDVYRTGNDRFAGIIRKVKQSIINIIPVRGSIIARNGNDILIDLGRVDGIEKDTVLNVIKRGKLFSAEQTMNLSYGEKDILGTIVVSIPGEEVSQGVLKLNGFYDLVNIHDEVFPVTLSSGGTDASSDVNNQTANLGNTPESAATGNNSENKEPSSEINTQVSEIISLIKSIK